jgi:hypothetical protein
MWILTHTEFQALSNTVPVRVNSPVSVAKVEKEVSPDGTYTHRLPVATGTLRGAI